MITVHPIFSDEESAAQRGRLSLTAIAGLGQVRIMTKPALCESVMKSQNWKECR